MAWLVEPTVASWSATSASDPRDRKFFDMGCDARQADSAKVSPTSLVRPPYRDDGSLEYASPAPLVTSKALESLLGRNPSDFSRMLASAPDSFDSL